MKFNELVETKYLLRFLVVLVFVLFLFLGLPIITPII